MTLVVEVEFLLDVFAGSDGSHDGAAPEWPPAPARLFAGLVAAAEGDDQEALEWLSGLGDPVIDCCSESKVTEPQRRWLVTNRVDETGGSSRHVGRKNVERARRRRWLSSPVVRYQWDAPTPPGMTGRLDRIARQVSYIGRPVSPVLVTVTEDHRALPNSSHTRFVPGSSRRGLDLPLELRTTYSGLLADLDAAFETGDRLDPPVRGSYVALQDEPAPLPADLSLSPWSDFVMFDLPSGVWLPAQRAMALATAFRAAVLSRLGDDAHPVITGHLDDSPHVAFVPVPAVGHPKSDGHLLGVAVGIPRGVPEVRSQLRRAFDESPHELALTLRNLRGVGPVRLVRRGAASPRRFPYVERSETWWTVTPAVLDKAPSRRLDDEVAVRASITRAGFPEPIALWAQLGPVRAGDPAFRMSDTLRRPGDRKRPFRYVVMRFGQPVEGPVLIGALRHFGLGLCRPWWLARSTGD